MSSAVAALLIKASTTMTGTRTLMGILRNSARDDDGPVQYQPDGRASTACGGIMTAAQAAPASANAAASSMTSRMLSASEALTADSARLRSAPCMAAIGDAGANFPFAPSIACVTAAGSVAVASR